MAVSTRLAVAVTGLTRAVAEACSASVLACNVACCARLLAVEAASLEINFSAAP